MAGKGYVVALDQGTTSSRSILYDLAGNEVRSKSLPFKISFPNPGWVEQDPEEIWQTQLATLREVSQGVEGEILALGITNQRETTVAWERKTGKPLHPAIVWQCRRSAEICARMREEGLAKTVSEKTGLVIDSYFSGSKIIWLLENVPGLKERVASGEVVFGTIDSWLLFKLTEGASFATEPSNASRTMLYSIVDGRWDAELLKYAGVGEKNLAQVQPSNSKFGTTKVLGPEIPITGILGDQQASLFGNGCFEPGGIKCTFGTGAFLLLNTGREIKRSETGLLTTVAWGTPEAHFAIEGSVFMAGALIQWLRDKLGIINSSSETEARAASVPDSGGVIIVPAFTGLGAPYWDEKARGAIFGLTRDSDSNHIIRAALEAIAHQVADLLDAPEFSSSPEIRIDGGMSANKLFAQILADTTQRKIKVSPRPELTAFGAAAMAAWGCGAFNSLAELKAGFFSSLSAETANLTPLKSQGVVAQSRTKWREAVGRVRTF